MPSPRKTPEKILLPLRDLRRPKFRPQPHALGINPETFREQMPSFVLNLPDYYPPSGIVPTHGKPPVIVEPRPPLPRPLSDTRPSIVDWRNFNGRNCVTVIRNQMQCGSCVAFGITALLESMVRVEKHMWLDLSEADLFEGGGSCKDGWFTNSAIDRVMIDGVPLERELPYPSNASETTVINALPAAGRIALAIKIANNSVCYNRESRKNYPHPLAPWPRA